MSLDHQSPMDEQNPAVLQGTTQPRGRTETDGPGRIHLILTPPEDSEETMESKYKQWQARVESGYIPQELVSAILAHMENIVIRQDNGEKEKLTADTFTLEQKIIRTQTTVKKIFNSFSRFAVNLTCLVHEYYEGGLDEKKMRATSILRYQQMIHDAEMIQDANMIPDTEMTPYADFFQISLGRESEGFRELIGFLFELTRSKQKKISQDKDRTNNFLDMWYMKADLEILFGQNGAIREVFSLLQKHLKEEKIFLESVLAKTVKLQNEDRIKIYSMLERVGVLEGGLEILFGHVGYFVPILSDSKNLERLLNFYDTKMK